MQTRRFFKLIGNEVQNKLENFGVRMLRHFCSLRISRSKPSVLILRYDNSSNLFGSSRLYCINYAILMVQLNKSISSVRVMRRCDPIMTQRSGHILGTFIILWIPNLVLLRIQESNELGNCEDGLPAVVVRIVLVIPHELGYVQVIITQRISLLR